MKLSKEPRIIVDSIKEETELIINKKTYDIVSYCLSIIENYKGKTLKELQVGFLIGRS